MMGQWVGIGKGLEGLDISLIGLDHIEDDSDRTPVLGRLQVEEASFARAVQGGEQFTYIDPVSLQSCMPLLRDEARGELR